jgi:ferredoxin--NADP+ reductase
VDCIHPRPDEPGFDTVAQLFIDPETCIDCGLCVDECPVKAIFADGDLPAKWRDSAEANAAYFRGQGSARI